MRMTCPNVLPCLGALMALGPVLSLSVIPAVAQSYDNDTGGSVTFYGQFSPVFSSVDDGEQDYSKGADNGNASTRLGFDLYQDLETATLRFNFETNLGIIQSAGLTQRDQDDTIDWDRTDLRKIEVIYSGGFGAVSVGQGSMATDGASGYDLSGTAVVGTVTVADFAGGYRFRDEDGNLTDATIGGVNDTFDGSRRMRLRYDTLAIAGVTLSASYGQEVLSEDDDKDYYDLGLKYGNELGGVVLAAGLGYAWARDDDADKTSEEIVGSVSALHLASGLSLTVSGGQSTTDDGQSVYTKLGWQRKIFDLGLTAFAVDFSSAQDVGTKGDQAETIGLLAVQNFKDLNLEAYIGYRQFRYDDSAVDYQDINAVLAGLRYRF